MTPLSLWASSSCAQVTDRDYFLEVGRFPSPFAVMIE